MPEVLVKKPIKCYHCGDDCIEARFVLSDKSFCCQGCQTVYELLEENNLCGYYDLENNPGIKVKARSLDKYTYLDNETIANALSEFNEEGVVCVNFYVPNIHCASCVWLLESLHKLREGVLYSRVNFTKREFSVSFQKNKISLRELVELMDSFGYAPEISLESYAKSKKKKESRSIIYKIGIAAFCSGNIMLLSFPSYFGLDEIQENSFVSLFGYLSLLLSMPVIFYSAQDFFISAYKGLKSKQINLDVPISLGIAAVFIRSIYEVLAMVGPGYFDSLTGLIFFMLIGKWYQQKTYSSFSFDRDYKSYFPVSTTLIEEGKEISTPIGELKKGDTILVRNQEVIPVDSTLLSEAAFINYSFVTGESAPVHRKKNSQLYAGGKQEGESILLRVEKKVSQGYLLQLWNKEVFKKESNAYLSSFVLTFSNFFVYGTVLIACITFGYWYFVDFSKAFFALTSVLLVACPCALALSLPFALGNSLSKLGKKGFYLRSADTVEKVSEIDTIVFDKTGTLTKTNKAQIEFFGTPLSERFLKLIKSSVKSSAHPLSRLLYNHIEGETISVDFFSEKPSKGVFCLVGGSQIEIGSAFWVGYENEEEVNETRVYVSIDGIVKGYYKITNEYRVGTQSLIKNLSKKYDLHLLSGDNDSEKEFLTSFFPNSDSLKFNQTPEDKLAYIESLEKSGKKVMMIGDGLNDAGALKAATIGLAISDDVYSFSPGCDGILESKSFGKLLKFLEYSKTTVSIIKASLVLSLAYNAVGLYYAAKGLLTPVIAAILMPMSSISVVLFVVLATNIFSRKMDKDAM